MAVSNTGQAFTQTFLADSDLSASQYYLVKAASTAGKVTISNTAGGSVLGVLQNDPLANEEAVVVVEGFSKVRANTESTASPTTFGNWVKSGSHGMAVGYVEATASTWAAGWVTETYSSGCGAYIEMFVRPMRIV